MVALRIDVVTFNENEFRAVDALFDDLGQQPTVWSRQGPEALETSEPRHIVLRHRPMRAQGNVLAAAKLAEAFADQQRQPTFVVFYGCAGSANASSVGSAFLVGHVSYASLGTVSPSGANEVVTLKNKWLCWTDPKDVDPIESIEFSASVGTGALDLVAATSLERAHVLATDKVIRVGASTPPVASVPGPPTRKYLKEEWTYGQAIAHAQEQAGGVPLLVEMESFGIGAVATALSFKDSVVIVRVVTDDLVNHATSDAQQAAHLMAGRVALSRVLFAMMAN